MIRHPRIKDDSRRFREPYSLILCNNRISVSGKNREENQTFNKTKVLQHLFVSYRNFSWPPQIFKPPLGVKRHPSVCKDAANSRTTLLCRAAINKLRATNYVD